MNRQCIFDYIQKKYDISPDYPWADGNAVLRHKDNRKWFGLIMRVPPEKLGLVGDTDIDILNVKCDPVLIGSLLMQEGYLRAYHMNKEQWISIRLNASIPEQDILELLHLSYLATQSKKK